MLTALLRSFDLGIDARKPLTDAQVRAVAAWRVGVTTTRPPGQSATKPAFAALAGAAPPSASSGNTVRHWLNRGGDRQLNRALEIIARVRMSNHPATRAYVERRLSEGKTRREIRRCLRRYIARKLFRCLSRLLAEPEQPSVV